MNQTYEVLVIEVQDLVPRRTPDKPNIFVLQRTSEVNRITLQGLGRSKRRIFVAVREDLGKSKLFDDKDAAKKYRLSLSYKIAKLGYTVNPDPKKKYSVYVLQLTEKVKGKARIYVGQTSKAVEKRIDEHLACGKLSASVVCKGFVKRLPELEPESAFFSIYDAIAEETALGIKYLNEGFDVHGPQGLPTKNSSTLRRSK